MKHSIVLADTHCNRITISMVRSVQGFLPSSRFRFQTKVTLLHGSLRVLWANGIRREPTESLVMNELNRLKTTHRNFRAADKQIRIKPSETFCVCSFGNSAENKVCWEQQT